MGWSLARKPEFWVPGLDRLHPLARGLVVAIPMLEPGNSDAYMPFDYAGRKLPMSSTRQRRAGRLGVGAYAADAAVNRSITFSCQEYWLTQNRTMAVLWQCESFDNLVRVASQSSWQILRYGEELVLFTQSEDYTYVFAGLPLPAAGEIVLTVGVIDSDNLSVSHWGFFEDSGLMLTRQSLSAPFRPSGYDLTLGNLRASDYPEYSLLGWIYGFWMWSRALADDEVRIFAEDSFAMFRMQRQQEMVLASLMPWQRRLIWGSQDNYAVPAGMRPAGSRSVFVFA